MALKRKTILHLRRAAIVALTILLVLFFLLGGVLAANLITDANIRKLPSYAREDLDPILAKDPASRTEEEKRTLFLQTGVSPSELEKMSPEEVLAFQDALFFEGHCVHEEYYRGLVYHDAMENFSPPIVDLQPGDILLTSSTHTLGWAHGHAALVMENGDLLQSYLIGYASGTTGSSSSNGVPLFQNAANFLVLRLKDADAATRLAIAQAAEKQLVNVMYDLTVGIFSPKDQGETPKSTHCSHLVWQAYKNFGYDLDSDGGPVVTPRDLARSPLLEVVQCYGFDPLKGWE